MAIMTRALGHTGTNVTILGYGAMELRGRPRGPEITDEDAGRLLNAVLDGGINLIDTSPDYGRSEELIGRYLGHRRDEFFLASKCGCPLNPPADATPPYQHDYTPANVRADVEQSLRRLGTDRLDLVQLHSPPTAVFASDAVFDALDTLVSDDCIAAYGVSVETSDQALTAIARPGVASVQIILNAFRRKPLDRVLPAAAAAGVGIIARVPLASGLLSGRYTKNTTFAADDHRSYNAHGEAFDVGETFSGVGLEAGADAAAEFASITGGLPGGTPAQWALRWVMQQPGVTTVIPGARSVAQARQNAEAASLPPLPQAELGAIEGLYDKYFRATVHDRW